MNDKTKTTVTEEPPVNSVVMLYGPEGTAWQRLASDGLWHSASGAVRRWDELAQHVHAVIYTPPTPEPWTLIPEGRENAAVLRVNGVVGTYFRDPRKDWVYQANPDGEDGAACRAVDATSVEPVHVVPEGVRWHGADEVPVPRELVERAKRNLRVTEPWGPVYDIVRDLAAVEGGGER